MDSRPLKKQNIRAFCFAMNVLPKVVVLFVSLPILNQPLYAQIPQSQTPIISQTPAQLDNRIINLENKIGEIRKELLENIKWIIGFILTLFTVLYGYTLFKTFVLDKEAKNDLKQELTDELKKILRDDIVQEILTEMTRDMKHNIYEIQKRINYLEYEIVDLSVEQIHNSSEEKIYKYLILIRQYITAIQILYDMNKQNKQLGLEEIEIEGSQYLFLQRFRDIENILKKILANNNEQHINEFKVILNKGILVEEIESLLDKLTDHTEEVNKVKEMLQSLKNKSNIYSRINTARN
ncbi:MAG: hypothetical protein V7K53_06505 [Nostoc sp.]|uniref:hypothetical protein n=1 Tax=Nostoc sp. TaxID=1180 RepID=UPI002FFAC904